MIEELFDQMSKGNLLLIDMTYDMFNGMQTYIGDPPFNTNILGKVINMAKLHFQQYTWG